MLIRTHLSIAVFFMLLLVMHVNNPLIFMFMVLIATMLPDIDCAFSTLGKSKTFRILQFFVNHRGVMHSLTFCIAISILLAFFWPTLAFGFFLGYSIHLFSDSFTKEGIIPFWPYPKKCLWKVKTSGIMESGIFLFFLLADVFLFVFLIL